MPTSHDHNGTIQPLAPSGGAVVGTIYKLADGVVCLALTAAASGVAFVAKVQGRVNGVSKVTGTAWTAGQPLAHDGTSFTHLVSGSRVTANAAAAAASADTTGDVILRLPGSVAA